MAAASEPTRWTGRTGRRYVPTPDEPIREGTNASVRAVSSTDPPLGRSIASAGTRLALRLPGSTDDARWRQEAQILQDLSHKVAMPPCPRIYDQVGEGPGLVMEWCPIDLEQWWASVMDAPEGFRALCQSLSEICRRLAEYSAFAREHDVSLPVIIRPQTLLRRGDGRWLLSRFGNPPRVAVEGSSTRIIEEPENFISPEVIFDATPSHQPASECWSVGCVLLSLLQMRVYSRSGMPIPPLGTSGHHFRSHRVNLVVDLYQRKPGLFRERALDSRQFLYPDRLPDPDRQVVEKAVEGLFGTSQPDLEAQLSRRILQLLDKSLSIEPSARHTDPIEIANELEQLGRWFRETAQSIGKAQSEPAAPVHTRVVAGPKRSKTDESLDKMKTTIAEQAEVVARISADNAALITKIEAAQGEARGARRMLWVGVGALAFTQAVLAVFFFTTQPPDAPPEPPPTAVVAPTPTVPSAIVPPVVEPEEPEPGNEEVLEPVEDLEPEVLEPEAPVPEVPASAIPAQAAPPVEAAPLTVTETPPEMTGTGRISISGASGWLVGPSGRVAPGEHPAGSYEVFVTIDGASLSLGKVSLSDGADLQFRCGFGTCKRVQ